MIDFFKKLINTPEFLWTPKQEFVLAIIIALVVIVLTLLIGLSYTLYCVIRDAIQNKKHKE